MHRLEPQREPRLPVVALDFDGVISDSATESFVVALRTYAALRPGTSIDAPARALRGASQQTVRAHPLYAPFLELMPLGNRAEDYAMALSILDRGADVRDQAAYDAAFAAEDERFRAVFHERFYREREALCDGDRAAWLALLGPFPEIVALLRRRRGDAVLALATAKDRRSVEILLDAYGIADVFPPARVLDKESGRSKRAHLSLLAERLGRPLADITFVDDKLNHLEDVADLGVRCVLAAWGYNGARERAAARACGFAVCDLADAEEILLGGTALRGSP